MPVEIGGKIRWRQRTGVCGRAGDGVISWDVRQRPLFWHTDRVHPWGEKIPTAMMPALREFCCQWSKRPRAGVAITHLLGDPSEALAGDRYRHGG